jgi:hypothetical protein
MLDLCVNDLKSNEWQLSVNLYHRGYDPIKTELLGFYRNGCAGYRMATSPPT